MLDIHSEAATWWDLCFLIADIIWFLVLSFGVRGTEGISGWTGGEEGYYWVGILGNRIYYFKSVDRVIGGLTWVKIGYRVSGCWVDCGSGCVGLWASWHNGPLWFKLGPGFTSRRNISFEDQKWYFRNSKDCFCHFHKILSRINLAIYSKMRDLGWLFASINFFKDQSCQFLKLGGPIV